MTEIAAKQFAQAIDIACKLSLQLSFEVRRQGLTRPVFRIQSARSLKKLMTRFG